MKVVGAGLVGALLATWLARRGDTVDVYERRADLRTGGAAEGRSINLAISVRGLHALKRVSLEEKALQMAIPMRGRMVHPREGETALQPYGRGDQCIHSISRAGLNALLMDAAEAAGARIHFGERLTQANAFSGQLTFQSERDAREHVVEAKRVFGTDGANSAMRAAFERVPGFASSEEALQHGYKEIVLPASSSARLERHALHIWPRQTYMLIALPNLDGSFTCTLFLPFKTDEAGRPAFDTLRDESALREFFLRDFPDVWETVPDLAAQFFAHPTGKMTTVRANLWNAGGRALLLGDAAHAIVPFFGQGMNCGFEDCDVLAELLEAQPVEPDWERLFCEFTRSRKPNSDAIADLAIENFVEMRDKVADPVFLFEKQVERILATKFPERYVPRYSLVSFSRVPYREAFETGEAQKRILRELSRGLAKPEDVDLEKARLLIARELG